MSATTQAPAEQLADQGINIEKSPRHSKIVGDFGEHVVCNWLSRSGFEVCIVDHIGIDLVAYHPETKQRMGISVKSRTRESGHQDDSVNLFFTKKEDRRKLEEACEAFGCLPWIGVYVESESEAHLYLTSLEHYAARYCSREGQKRVIDDWKMTQKHREQYSSDLDVKHIHIKFGVDHWWETPPTRKL